MDEKGKKSPFDSAQDDNTLYPFFKWIDIVL